MDRYDNLENEMGGVKDTLVDIITEKLDAFGIYYRIFSRVKSGRSIRHKLGLQTYVEDQEKKINDLIGIRIVLYYQDDIDVCKILLENYFNNTRWHESEIDESSFEAYKTNGTFLLPGFVKKVVVPKIEGLRIEPTFEVQIRTVSFEGWHEAEHDLRYKEMDLWKNKEKESRKLNSIIAALEMCDQYMVSLLDDLGHDFYKNEDWENMIRYRYRLRNNNYVLSPEMKAAVKPLLAKRVFKWSKKEIVRKAFELGVEKLDADAMVYIVNEHQKGYEGYQEDIPKIYADILKSRKDKKYEHQNNIIKLKANRVFYSKVILDIDENNPDKNFEKLMDIIYHDWICQKTGDVFEEKLQKDIHEMARFTDSVSVVLNYKFDERSAYASIEHCSISVPGGIWCVIVTVNENDKGELELECTTTFKYPETFSDQIVQYSRPGIYKTIAKKIGIKDVITLNGKINKITENKVENLIRLVKDEDRRLPVVLITADYESDVYKSLIGTGDGRIPILSQKIGDVAHLYAADCETGKMISRLLNEDEESYCTSVRIFDTSYTALSYEEILSRPKEVYARYARKPHRYEMVSGADAVRYEIVERIYRNRT